MGVHQKFFCGFFCDSDITLSLKMGTVEGHTTWEGEERRGQEDKMNPDSHICLI